MGNRLARPAVAAVGAAVAALLFAGWPVAAASAAVSIVPSGTSGCASEYCFQPASLPVNGGDAVTWTNNSGPSHTVTRCGAAPGQNDTGCPAIGAAGNTGDAADTFNSGFVSPAGTFSHTFTAAGDYTYYCRVHGYGIMHATVSVSAVGPSPSASAGVTPSPTAALTPSPGGTVGPVASASPAQAALPKAGGGPAAPNPAGWLLPLALFGLLSASVGLRVRHARRAGRPPR
jgi:plastocyanin